jgi:UDP-N-acetylglucosamine:LPS N-acetylglucosamine transferase
VFGGSLGSLRINEAVWQAASSTQLPTIHHVVGRRDWEKVPASLPNTIRSLEYDENLPKAIAAADLVVCRPGGSTSAELAVLGVPAILVPLPNAPNDHQRRNAEVLMKAGLATLVEDAELVSLTGCSTNLKAQVTQMAKGIGVALGIQTRLET